MRFTVLLAIYLLLSYSPLVSSITFKNISLQKVCDGLELSPDQCCMAEKALKFLGYGGLAAAASIYGIPFVLGQLGFSTGGIVGGSFAAWWQAAGTAPRLFAMIQSTSMKGAGTYLMAKIGVSAAAWKSYLSSCDTKVSSDAENCKKDHKC